MVGPEDRLNKNIIVNNTEKVILDMFVIWGTYN
jgi:hypothetical protein